MRDLDLTPDKIFTKSPIPKRFTFMKKYPEIFLGKDGDIYTRKIERDYGKMCIRCGANIIEFSSSKSAIFLSNFDSSVSSEVFKELCVGCEVSLQSRFENNHTVLRFEKPSIKEKFAFFKRNLFLKKEKRVIRKLEDFYSVERSQFVSWALKNKKNIWD